MTEHSRVVDLSHQLYTGMDPYPGLPEVHIEAHLDHVASRSHYEGDEFFLGKVDMPANVGTYLDSPFHRFADAADLSRIPLERLIALRGFVIDAGEASSRGLNVEDLPTDIAGAAVLFRTGWDSRWGSDAYWEPGPYLSEELAERLIRANVGLVGVDFLNVDDTTTRRRPIHTELLRNDILIVEHLCNLGALPTSGFRFSAPVLAIERGASFPVRAYAEIDGS